MKRDMDLVRRILMKIESHEHGIAPYPLMIDGASDELVGYHIHLLGQAGLLAVDEITSLESDSPEAMALHMTWTGHDFLDAARSDTIWNRAKQRVAGTVGSVTFEAFKALLVALAKEKLGLSTD